MSAERGSCGCGRIVTLQGKDIFLKLCLLIPVLIVCLSFSVFGGNVIVRNGQLNVSAGIYGDSDTFYIDSENDRVGIGTTSPGNTLTVSGDVALVSATDVFKSSGGSVSMGENIGVKTLAKSVYVKNSGDTTILAMLGYDGTGYFSGKVGIGTESPEHNLDVEGNITSDFYRFDNNTNDDDKYMYSPSDGILRWTTHNSASGHAFEIGHQDILIYWHFDTTGNSYYDGDGYVGIGTASPSMKLDIAASAGNGIKIRTPWGGAADNTSSNGIYWTYDGVPTEKWAAIESQLHGDSDASIKFETKPSGGGGLQERMRIDRNGNIGIGTTEPKGTLQLSNKGMLDTSVTEEVVLRHNVYYSGGDKWLSTGNKAQQLVLSNDGFLFYSSDDSSTANSSITNFTEKVRITNAGNVGIGTTSPSSRLHIIAGGYANPVYIDANCAGGFGYTPALVFRGLDGTSVATDYVSFKYGIDDNTNGSEDSRLYINTLVGGTDTTGIAITGGYVGIGTTSPGAKLEISLTGSNTAGTNNHIYFSNGAGTDLFGLRLSEDNGYLSIDRTWSNWSSAVAISRNTGYVGIGTTGPGATLDVEYAQDTLGLELTSPGYDTDNLNGGLKFHSTTDTGQQGDIVLYHSGIAGTQGLSIWGYPSDNNPACCNRIVDFLTNGTSYFSGNVGIGTSSPDTLLHLQGSTDIIAKIKSTGSDSNARLQLINDAQTWQIAVNGGQSDSLIFREGTIGSDVIAVATSGKVGIGTTTPELKLDVEGDIEIGTGTTGCVRDSDNTTIAGTCSSDIRLKQDVESLDNVLDNVSLLRPVTFKWIGGNVTEYGLIAQEVREVMPELVSEDDEGYLRVSYDSKLFMLMLESIKELKEEKDAEISELKEENDALRAEDERKTAELLALKQAVCEIDPDVDFCTDVL